MPLTVQTTTNVHLRGSPGGAILATVPAGQAVLVSGLDGEWAQVQHGAQVGVMHRAYLRPVSGSFAVRVKARGLNLRAGADPSAAVLAVLTQGAVLEVSGWQDDRLAVQTPSGQGYVSAAHVEPVVEAPLLQPTVVGRLPDPAAVRARRGQIAAALDGAQRADAYEALQLRGPYYTQRDNQATEGGVRVETEGGRMCNLTSLAMVLAGLGIDNPRPGAQYEDVLEALRQEHGLAPRTELRGWAAVAALFNVGTALLAGEGIYRRSWWESTVRPRLRDGECAMMSISNHIVRLLAVNADGLVVDDPYGRSRLRAGSDRSFDERNAWSAASPTVGQGTVYPWADVEVHTMRWVASLTAAVGPLAFGGDDLPDLRDDGPSDPTAG